MDISVVQSIVIFSLVFTIAAVGLSMIVGYAGIFSAGHAAIFGVGGFTYAVLASRDVTHELLIVLPIAMVIGGALSAVAALPALRLRGDYFLVASVGFQIVVLKLIVNWEDVSGGPPGLYGLPLPSIGGFWFGSPGEMLSVIAPIVILVIGASTWVVRSSYGRLLRGLADDEVAVRASGTSTSVVKLGVFVYGGVLASVAGVLYVSYLQVASPADFELAVSIGMLAMVLIGGAGSIWGPVLGAAVLSSMPYWLGLTSLSDVSANVSDLIFGLVLVLVAVFSPDGVAGGLRAARRRSKKMRGPHPTAVPAAATASPATTPDRSVEGR
jgi:branched-chain amino acid transport system permease protein